MKVRNLQQSHDYREYKKRDPAGAFYMRRRIFRPSPGPPKERDVAVAEQPVEKAVIQTKDALDEEIERTRSEREVVRKWVDERKTQRKDLNALGLNYSWMENKSTKTECEKRVLQRMGKDANQHEREAAEREREAFLLSKNRKKRVSSVHVDLLPYVKSALPIALAMIADYLTEKRLRLLDLFTKVDKNKDWKMTRDELKMAFRRIDIPLSDAELSHLILALDVNNDNELSYKEVAQGIDAYHKDRRWQRMKTMYDNMIAESSEDAENPSSEIEYVANLDQLNLPTIDVPRHQRRKRHLLRQRGRFSQNEADNLDDSFHTTMSGSLLKKRIEVLKFLDNECGHCLEKLHENGIFIRRKDLERVFIPPKENPETECIARLSSARSVFPFAHPINVSYRKNQRKVLKRIARESTSRQDNRDEASAPDQQKKKQSKRFLPRVASFKEISKEGRKKRRQIENASPSPYWPQHLLDKLCLCMDTCHIASDRKEVMFNLVK